MSFTQRQLADKVSVKQRQIARYEAGDATPRDRVLYKISEACGVTFDWLKTGEGCQKAEGDPEVKDVRQYIESRAEESGRSYSEELVVALNEMALELKRQSESGQSDDE